METWLPIVGFEGLYDCSQLGNFRSARGGHGTRLHKPVKPYKNPRTGYLQLALRKDCKYHRCNAHRLIAKTFIGESALTVNHINGNKTDNRVENLCYATQRENLLHATRTLGVRRGEKHWKARLSEYDIRQIKLLRIAGMLQKDIGALFGIKRASVAGILAGAQWAHVK